MKAIVFLLALALVGTVIASPATETVTASHMQCEGHDRPCDYYPTTPDQFVCALLSHYGLCR